MFWTRITTWNEFQCKTFRVELPKLQLRRPGAEFGGTDKFFADQDFLITYVFSENISIFTPKMSYDHYSIKRKFLYDHFFLCSYFHAHLTTLLLKILGRRMHWPSPTSHFGGPSTQSPLGLRPC